MFTSQILSERRARNIDIDSIAYIHQQNHQPAPNKTTKAFTAPPISKITERMQTLTPPAGEGTALLRLQLQTDRLQKQKGELQRARDKLRTRGVALTPTKVYDSAPRRAAPAAPTLRGMLIVVLKFDVDCVGLGESVVMVSGRCDVKLGQALAPSLGIERWAGECKEICSVDQTARKNRMGFVDVR